CLVARMSGSGATCFGLYADAAARDRARAALAAAHPDWWVAA
ncbi:MAG: 4-(cytidine 5'-diphospho)-2-C-methyl-D-erythritol kinase, partial [Paracoccaceae bacterium]|nr:4-(cytidine 5'-diphospho)-2-C-methyl-D-erythritol kinase [Paracoccaceae bacterium]